MFPKRVKTRLLYIAMGWFYLCVMYGWLTAKLAAILPTLIWVLFIGGVLGVVIGGVMTFLAWRRFW